MFEAYTYERLLEDVLENAPEKIDTRPGSIFYDAISGQLLKIARLYTDLDQIFELIFIDSAEGQYLDKKASEHGLERLDATSCCYYFFYEGTQPESNERFFFDGRYFILKKTDEGILFLMAEEPGIVGNDIYIGTHAVPVNNIPGLTSATFGDILEIGTDTESDDDLRDRLREKIAGPAENGNKQHYKTWCEQVDGVGRARIIPLWKGPNTVKGILINALGMPADDTVVDRVQKYVDPDDDGDGDGDGLGEGEANMGSHFTAVAATEYVINLSFDATLTSGATKEQTIQETTGIVTNYLKNLALETPDKDELVVRISTVGAIIHGLPSILDYKNLTLNGNTANIQPGYEAVAILGGVTVNVLQ